MRLVDSHAHLDQCGDPARAVAAARGYGVARVVSVGFDLKTSRRAVELANSFDGVGAAVGIHPHDAGAATSEAMRELAALAADPRVLALGETGLDYYRDLSPRETQKRAFRRQIELAGELGLTLMVHSRQAEEDTLQMLERHAAGLRIVLHCFSLHEQLDRCADLGFFMSVAGNVTFPKADELRRAAARIPDSLLLTETDSPWLSPVPHRGRPNRPENVRFVAAEIASLRGLPVADLTRLVAGNFTAAFPNSERF